LFVNVVVRCFANVFEFVYILFQADLRKKAEEVECLRESLAKAKDRLEQEKRLNAAIKQKKVDLNI